MSARHPRKKDQVSIWGYVLLVFITLTSLFMAGKTTEKIGWTQKGKGFKAAIAGSIAFYFSVPVVMVCIGFVAAVLLFVYGTLQTVAEAVQGKWKKIAS